MQIRRFKQRLKKVQSVRRGKSSAFLDHGIRVAVRFTFHPLYLQEII
jgi:hypothetical protein